MAIAYGKFLKPTALVDLNVAAFFTGVCHRRILKRQFSELKCWPLIVLSFLAFGQCTTVDHPGRVRFRRSEPARRRNPVAFSPTSNSLHTPVCPRTHAGCYLLTILLRVSR